MYKIIGITIIVLLSVAGCSATPAAVEKPVIDNFAANPGLVKPDEYTMLSWSVTNAISVDIDQGIGNVARASGSKVISPGASRTYTLTATNSVGSVTRSTVINVIPQSDNQPGAPAAIIPSVMPPSVPPILISFSAASPRIKIGSSSVLRWNVSNATAVTINGDVGSVSPVGNMVVSPNSTRTYTLTATNSRWSTAKSIVINVIQRSDNRPASALTASVPSALDL